MKKIFLLAAVTLALAACDKNDDNPVSPSGDPVRVSATIGESVLSRASDTKWAPGDRIGISTTVGSHVGPYTNLEYTTAGGDGNFSGTPIYFYKPMVLTAYYPFAGTAGEAPGTVTGSTTADFQTPGKQPEIDFLWDSKTDISSSDPEVKFTFSHKMSKLTFTFIDGDETKASNIKRYEIEGLALQGTFDTATGVCTASATPSAENLVMDLTGVEVESGTPLSSLILFPQAPGTDKVRLHIYTDEFDDESYLQHYISTLALDNGSLKSGFHYNYKIKINKKGLTVSSGITDWLPGTTQDDSELWVHPD